MIRLTAVHEERFNRDGFVVLEGVLDRDTVDAARARFAPLFSGEFATGLAPDEWNWRPGGREDVTRQICNGWKSDPVVADVVLREDVGEACARLRGWPGARICDDARPIW